MYSLEDRMKAVDLYFGYGCSPAAVRRELGYPTKNTVKAWAREYNGPRNLDTKPGSCKV